MPVRDFDRDFSAQIEQTEIAAWQKVLGVTLDVRRMPGVPPSVTPESVAILEENYFGVRFIPVPESLKPGDEVREKYSFWRPYEQLTDQEKTDPTVYRNLPKEFWEFVKKEQIFIRPRYPTYGLWVAVETMPKPSQDENYPVSPVTDILRFKTRFNQSWNGVTERLRLHGERIIQSLGLPERTAVGQRMRADLLEVCQYVLLANREGLGKTDTAEWTRTAFRRDFDTNWGISSGDLRVGGAGGFHTEFPMLAIPGTGFRVAIEL